MIVAVGLTQGMDLAELPTAALQGLETRRTTDMFDVLLLRGSLNTGNVPGGIAPAHAPA